MRDELDKRAISISDLREQLADRTDLGYDLENVEHDLRQDNALGFVNDCAAIGLLPDTTTFNIRNAAYSSPFPDSDIGAENTVPERNRAVTANSSHNATLFDDVVNVHFEHSDAPRPELPKWGYLGGAAPQAYPTSGDQSGDLDGCL